MQIKHQLKSEGTFGEDRVSFGDLPIDDKDPISGKVGVRSHYWIVAIFLRIFNKIVDINICHDGKYTIIHLNRGSIDKWLERHGEKGNLSRSEEYVNAIKAICDRYAAQRTTAKETESTRVITSSVETAAVVSAATLSTSSSDNPNSSSSERVDPPQSLNNRVSVINVSNPSMTESDTQPLQQSVPPVALHDANVVPIELASTFTPEPQSTASSSDTRTDNSRTESVAPPQKLTGSMNEASSSVVSEPVQIPTLPPQQSASSVPTHDASIVPTESASTMTHEPQSTSSSADTRTDDTLAEIVAPLQTLSSSVNEISSSVVSEPVQVPALPPQQSISSVPQPDASVVPTESASTMAPEPQSRTSSSDTLADFTQADAVASPQILSSSVNVVNSSTTTPSQPPQQSASTVPVSEYDGDIDCAKLVKEQHTENGEADVGMKIALGQNFLLQIQMEEQAANIHAFLLRSESRLSFNDLFNQFASRVRHNTQRPTKPVARKIAPSALAKMQKSSMAKSAIAMPQPSKQSVILPKPKVETAETVAKPVTTTLAILPKLTTAMPATTSVVSTQAQGISKSQQPIIFKQGPDEDYLATPAVLKIFTPWNSPTKRKSRDALKEAGRHPSSFLTRILQIRSEIKHKPKPPKQVKASVGVSQQPLVKLPQPVTGLAQPSSSSTALPKQNAEHKETVDARVNATAIISARAVTPLPSTPVLAQPSDASLCQQPRKQRVSNRIPVSFRPSALTFDTMLPDEQEAKVAIVIQQTHSAFVAAMDHNAIAAKQRADRLVQNALGLPGSKLGMEATVPPTVPPGPTVRTSTSPASAAQGPRTDQTPTRRPAAVEASQAPSVQPHLTTPELAQPSGASLYQQLRKPKASTRIPVSFRPPALTFDKNDDENMPPVVQVNTMLPEELQANAAAVVQQTQSAFLAAMGQTATVAKQQAERLVQNVLGLPGSKLDAKPTVLPTMPPGSSVKASTNAASAAQGPRTDQTHAKTDENRRPAVDQNNMLKEALAKSTASAPSSCPAVTPNSRPSGVAGDTGSLKVSKKQDAPPSASANVTGTTSAESTKKNGSITSVDCTIWTEKNAEEEAKKALQNQGHITSLKIDAELKESNALDKKKLDFLRRFVATHHKDLKISFHPTTTFKVLHYVAGYEEILFSLLTEKGQSELARSYRKLADDDRKRNFYLFEKIFHLINPVDSFNILTTCPELFSRKTLFEKIKFQKLTLINMVYLKNTEFHAESYIWFLNASRAIRKNTAAAKEANETVRSIFMDAVNDTTMKAVVLKALKVELAEEETSTKQEPTRKLAGNISSRGLSALHVNMLKVLDLFMKERNESFTKMFFELSKEHFSTMAPPDKLAIIHYFSSYDLAQLFEELCNKNQAIVENGDEALADAMRATEEEFLARELFSQISTNECKLSLYEKINRYISIALRCKKCNINEKLKDMMPIHYCRYNHRITEEVRQSNNATIEDANRKAARAEISNIASQLLQNLEQEAFLAIFKIQLKEYRQLKREFKAKRQVAASKDYEKREKTLIDEFPRCLDLANSLHQKIKAELDKIINNQEID